MSGIRVGIVANEFFEPSIGRVGGFGWAARRALAVLRDDERFAPPVFFCGERMEQQGELYVDNTRVILPTRSRLRDAWTAWQMKIDVLLTIDYRPTYARWFRLMPFTPGIVWVRDPRTPEDMARIRTLRIPGTAAEPGGVPDWNFRSLSGLLKRQPYPLRRILLANKMAYMRAKIPGTFGLPPSDHVLPNPDVVDYAQVQPARSKRPLVVSLGRLDPVKRPWLFIELARHFPEVDFVMLGKPFVEGSGGWQVGEVPANLKLMGNLAGAAKRAVLSQAWVLVNTSIHEESAVSMMEALAHEVPVISYIESDQISQRFGICLGYDTGDGLASLPRLRAALAELLQNHERRQHLGRLGRQWVMAEHHTRAFLDQFVRIAAAAGVKKAQRCRAAPRAMAAETAGPADTRAPGAAVPTMSAAPAVAEGATPP
jgi:glycosyltransferase involved in cell wall biosynthesis